MSHGFKSSHFSNLVFLCSLFSKGSLKVMVYPTIYSLERIPEGLKKIEDRETWGKSVVRVRNDDGSLYIETQKTKL